ncbi:MAG: discoidin domain-containing protein, partial [Clostridia bacterium]|nr:discoidin domain-containing protein [Clostridia bacterium]
KVLKNGKAKKITVFTYKPKKGYAFADDVIWFDTTPAVVARNSTQGVTGGPLGGLFDRTIYQFVNEAEGYYNPYTGTASGDPHVEMNNIFKAEGDKAWMEIDLGKAYTFSAVRLFGRWGQPNQSMKNATIYVSDDGSTWVAAEEYTDTWTQVSKAFDEALGVPGNGANMSKYASTDDVYMEAPLKAKGTAYNVTARYIKVETSQTNGAHWSVQELLLVKENDSLDTVTVTGFKEKTEGTTIPEDSLDYYDPSKYFDSMVAGSEWNAGSPVADAFDGITDNVKADGTFGADDNGNYWHSAATNPVSEAQRTITVMFKNPINVGGFRVYGRHDSTNSTYQYGGNPGTVRIEATYDGENWFKATGSVKTGLTAGGVDDDPTTDDGTWQGTFLLNGELDNKFKGIRYVIEKSASGSATAHTNVVELQILKATTYESPFEADDFTAYPAWTITSGSDAGKTMANLGFLTDGIRPATNTFQHSEMNNAIYPAENKAGWLIVDLGEEQSFSGVRVYPRINGEGNVWASQTISKGYLYVSDNGTDWVQAELSTDINTTTGIFNATALAEDEVRNVKARYVKVAATQTGLADTNQHWSATELRLIKPVSGKETLTVTAFAELFEEETFEGYYTNAADWTWTVGSQYSADHGVENLYDGKVYGNMGACWHSAVNGDKSVTIMFDKDTAVGGVRVFPRTVQGGASANVIKMQGTYDGTTWVDILSDTSLGFTSGSKEEYKEAYLPQARNNTFKGIKFIVVKGIDGGSSYTNITELQVLTPVAPKVTFPEDEVEMGYPLGTAATYIVKAGAADTVRNGTDRGKILLDGDYITHEEFVALGAPGNGVSSRQLHHDFCISGQNGDSVYIKYDLGKVYEFSGVRLYQRAGGNQNLIEGYIYVSEDGENWVSSDALTGAKAVISSFADIRFGGTAYNMKARYIKIHCTKSQAGVPGHWGIEEVRLLDANSANETKTPSEIVTALAAKAEAVETLINAIGTVTLESKDAIKAARTAYDALSPAVKPSVDNYDVLVAAEAAYLALAGAALDGMVDELVISDLTAEDAEMVAELKEIYDSLSDEAKAEIDGAKLETAATVVAGLSKTIDPTVNGSGKLGYATLDYTIYTSGNDVTVTGVTYKGEAVTNANDEWKAVTNGDGTVTLTLGGNYYKSEAHRHWLYSSTLDSIKSHENGGNYYKFRTANVDLGIQVGDEVTENTYNGFFVRELTNEGGGKKVLTVSLSDGTTKDIILNVNYTWRSVSGALASTDTDAITPFEWQVTTNGAAPIAHAGANWFNGNYGDATNSQSYTAQYYDATGAEKGTQHFVRAAGPYKIWVDFGRATKFAGVRLNDKNYNLTNVSLYGSNDLVTWTKLGSISGNNSKTAQVDLQDNANYRYARIDIDEYQNMNGGSFLFLNEIVFLEASTRIIGGDIGVDLSEEIADVTRKFNSDNEYEITSVKVAGEEIAKDTDYVLDTTKAITFKASYLGALEVGEYDVEITFASDEVLTTKLVVKDLSLADYYFMKSGDAAGTYDLVLYNSKGLDVKGVAIEGGDSVEFTASNTEIRINRTKFRRAINRIGFEKLPAEGAYGLKVNVTFEDDSTKVYTVNLRADWIKTNGEVTTTFLADEITVNPEWKVRTDSANASVAQPFYKAAINKKDLQNWHSFHAAGNGDAPSGGVHFIDIDFGAPIEVGGLRYVSRANQADWGNVTISGSDDYTTWTKLYEGKGTGAAGAYPMAFTQNSNFRYIRIKMDNISHTTADTIHFLKPTLAVTGETVFKKDINATDEEIEISIEDIGDTTISKVVLGSATLTASQYEYDAETDTIVIKAATLNTITTEGDVVLAIETSTGKVGSVTVKYMDFSKKMFPQEVTPYHFDHEARIVSGVASGNIATITNRKVTTKSDGSALTNSDWAHTALTHDATFMIYSPSGTGKNWNDAPGYFEVDYKIPHEFSGVRLYHRIWADGGVRQYFTTIKEGYMAVSNDGINWVKSDIQTFGAGNLDSLNYNRNAFDDMKFIVDGVPTNVSARYVRVYPTKNGAWQPIGLEEICLYEPSSAYADLKAADIKPGAATYSLATLEDLTFNVEWNDSITLGTISIVTEEDGEDVLVPINSAYYFCDEETFTISKYFFIDGGYDVGDEIVLSVGFAVGKDILVPVTIAEAEEYEVNYSAGENGTLKAVVRYTDMATGEEVEEEVASGSMVGRHENLVFVAEGAAGYEPAGWTLEGKGEDDVKYVRVTDKKDWEFDATNAMEPVTKAFDGNDKTYWHSEYETKTTGSPNPTHLLSDGPYWITALFDEPMMISEMTHTARLNDNGAIWNAGQKVRKYKVWGTTDGGETFDVLLAEGTTNQSDITDMIPLADVGYIDGIKFEIYSTFASATKSHCTIGEIVFTEKIITENLLDGNITYTGSASQEFEIDDLFGDATVTVEFAAIEAGYAKITADVKKLEAEIEETKVPYGENAEITLVPEEGEELPEEITVVMDGAELKEGQDYTYDSATGEIVVKNVKGNIEILAVAAGVDVFAVTYEDVNGATGTLPEADLYTEGETFKLPASKLKLSGSTFVGWKASSDGETYKAGKTFTMVAEDVTFTAVWEAKESGGDDEGTKRPSVGGGGGSSSSGNTGLIGGGIGTGANVNQHTITLVGIGTQKVATGTVIADPAAKEGYDFIGWYLDEAFTVPYANTGIIENVTLYPYYRRVRSASELSDIAGHWGEKTIGEMYVAYLVNGTADGKFEPDKSITRAEFCQILYLMSGQTTDGAHNFTDVNVGDWFTNAVAWAVKSGITQGTSETTFAPYENITREQMATMIYRYATLMGHDWTITKEAGFADQAEVATYANYQVNWAADKGIINGYPDGTFGPKANATKAEAVTMLQRLLNLGK